MKLKYNNIEQTNIVKMLFKKKCNKYIKYERVFINSHKTFLINTNAVLRKPRSEYIQRVFREFILVTMKVLQVWRIAV